jgi:3-oxoadipate enol-lactonase
MPFAHVNNVTLHYRLIGDPAVQPVMVFSNSLGTDFRIWEAVADSLAREFALLLYDNRGHGLSDLGSTPYRIEDFAADLAALLEHLSIGRATICGLSVGGLIAQGLYAAAPEKVRALILCDTAVRVGSDQMWNARIDAVHLSGLAPIADTILRLWFTDGYRTPENPDFAGYRNMLVGTPVAGYVATCEALREADFTVIAAGITVPTLCVVGEFDGATPPALVAATAKLIPGAEFTQIPGAGHLPCIEQPALLVEAITDFLDRLPDGGE